MKVLNLDNWCKEAEDILWGYWDEDGNDWISDTVGVIASLDNPNFNYSQFDNLRFIASCTTGLDHIDTEYCKAHGIDIISLQGEIEFLRDVRATSEHAWALIMALIRKVPFAHNDVCAGNWKREAWQGTELCGKTLGIVGHGRIGHHVYGYANAFGMNSWVYDKVSTKDDLKVLLGESDIVTVHVPLNEETTGMFSYKEFALMKPTAYFINTSRGAVVDEEALLDALYNKKIAGAALDVVCGEPNNINPKLLAYAETYDNLILTPHIGGNTAESRRNTQLFIANKIKSYIENL